MTAAAPVRPGGLQLTGVVKRFGAHVVLDGVDLQVEQGTIHAVIGPNGAGKSTLFGVIAGEHRPDHGRVSIDGRAITRLGPSRRVRLGVARAFQVAHVFPSLTVLDNVVSAALTTGRHAHRIWPSAAMRHAREQARATLEETGLTRLSGVRAHELSQGDRKRLEIAVTLQLRPRVLLLDEPTAGMSPEETAETVALVHDLWARSGLTVLLTEHDMSV
ncbi:MAG: ATP-binding cassette domain-containing protein, partial [Jatrophihabitans sp.]